MDLRPACSVTFTSCLAEALCGIYSLHVNIGLRGVSGHIYFFCFASVDVTLDEASSDRSKFSNLLVTLHASFIYFVSARAGCMRKKRDMQSASDV